MKPSENNAQVPEKLIEAYFDGSITPEGEERLRLWLEADAAHMDEFLQQLDVHVSLWEKLSPLAGKEQADLPKYSGRDGSPAAPGVHQAAAARRRGGWFRRLIVPLTAAAAVLIAAVAYFLVVGLGTGPRKELYAEVVAIGGQVELVRPDGAAAAAAGQTISPGEGLRTAADGSAKLRYPDGTTIEVGAATDLSIQKHEKAKRISLKSGELLAEVSVQPAGAPMILETPQAQAKVIGTIFKLSSTPASTRLEVTRGSVELVRKADREAVTVQAGFYAEAKEGVKLAAGPLTDMSYNLAFSTYFGGSGADTARDVCTDDQGNIYVAGGTASADFPTTPGVYQRTQDKSGGQIGSEGYSDGFVAKFSPDGRLIWSTLLGGPDYDKINSVKVDKQGGICVAGRAGPGFPTTAGVFQPDFQGVEAGAYGQQNAFVAKLKPDGSGLVWSSYVGTGTTCRDMAIDGNGNIYIPSGYHGAGDEPPAAWFANAFQKTRKGRLETNVIKIRSDGSAVLWATWLGGADDEMSDSFIRVDEDGHVYVAGSTRSADFPTTAGAFSRTLNGDWDGYAVKLRPDGSSLVYGTYLGGAGDDIVRRLTIDRRGNAYCCVSTNSANFPATPGAFQRTLKGVKDIAVAKISSTGALLAGTFVGGKDGDDAEGMCADENGSIFLGGFTASANFPVTTDAWQAGKGGGKDGVLVRLSADFSRLLYATRLGGSSNDTGFAVCLGPGGSLYLAGHSSRAGWPVNKALQPAFKGGKSDCVIAGFTPAAQAAGERMPGNSNEERQKK